MKTNHNLNRFITGVLLAGSVGAAGLGLGAGAAQADNDGPHRWCPGQSMSANHGGPGSDVVWDMNVCHTWYWLHSYGQGNVANNYGGPPGVPDVWDGDNPPGASPPQCGPGAPVPVPCGLFP